MADLATLRSLRERVIAATGADREIDARVWWATADHTKTDADILARAEVDILEAVKYAFGPSWRSFRHVILPYTTSLDAARSLVARVLPGWWVSSGTCNLTGHASLGPDYNGPDRERLFREFPVERYDDGFHEDLAPGDAPGREAQAIVAALLSALIARTERGGAA